MSVVVSIGSNLGERLAHLRVAVQHLPAVTAVSSVYETDPVGGPEQPAYLNAVVLLGDGVSPREAFEAGQRAEQAAGRVRRERWGPRTLDVDVIAAASDVDEVDLVVPHPRAGERAFVLVPWVEVDPSAVLRGVPVRDLVDGIDTSGVRRTNLSLKDAV